MKKECKTEVLQIRLTKTQKQLLRQLSDISNMTMAEYLLSLVNQRYLFLQETYKGDFLSWRAEI